MIGIGIATMSVIAALLIFPTTRTLAGRYASACAKLLASFSESATDLADQNADYRKPVPDVAMTDAAGALIRVRDLRGKVALLTFWTANCATCDTEIAWFREFETTYGQRGLVFLNRQVARGQDDEAAHLFGGLNAIPTTFLIDKSGRIAVTHGGFCTKSEFDTAIKALLNERSQ
jgi:cytochrome c biogenesis protein CcmG/thiol:disulfide interchange protein DsbE